MNADKKIRLVRAPHRTEVEDIATVAVVTADAAPKPLSSDIAAARLEIPVPDLIRRAEAAWNEVLKALDAGLVSTLTGPDAQPPESAIDRAAVLVGMLMHDDPMADVEWAIWSDRGLQLVRLHEALGSVDSSTPYAPAMFSELRQTLKQATIAVERELAWRKEILVAVSEGRAIAAMPFALRPLWSSDDSYSLGRRKRGAKPTRRAIAGVAHQYGLRDRHMALLESALRIDIGPWESAVLPWRKGQKLYLEPLDGAPPDHVTDDGLVEAWRKMFKASTTPTEG